MQRPNSLSTHRGARRGAWPRSRKILAWVGIGCVLMGAVGWAAAAYLKAEFDRVELANFVDVRGRHLSSDLSVLDRRGEPIAELRQDFTERRGQWIPLASVSDALLDAVLASEDRRFHAHGGVDFQAVAASAWRWALYGERRGASTLSMQVAALLDPSLRRPSAGRGFSQKLRQALAAWQLERDWSKEQILEAYLNLVAFRGELRGVDAMARTMFGRHPHALGNAEAAVAAVLLRGPNATEKTVVERACGLMKYRAAQTGVLAGQPRNPCADLEDVAGRALRATARPQIDVPVLAPHFSRLAARERGPGETTVRSTLDAALQRVALSSVQRHLAGMGNAQLTDAAVVVLHNETGEVLAYVGSSGRMSSAADVDHARALRQPGSTLKPFLYALALELRYLTAASLLEDSELGLVTATGLYRPRNYDEMHTGRVSVRGALASSLNIPAVRVQMLVGTERFADRLRRCGLPLRHEAEHYGYSLSLGSADVDLLSLVNAYRSLAMGGQWSPLRWTMDRGPSEAPRQVGTPASTWLIGHILSDRNARARTFGLENALATPFWTAVKTGTSRDMRDNWAVGWSRHYTVGVWVGNSHGLSMRDVSGVTGAAPIWHEIMSHLHRQLDSSPPPLPTDVRRGRVTFAEGEEPDRDEYFLAGTQLTAVAALGRPVGASARIAEPVDGSVIALDPDVPMANQRLSLKAAVAHEEAQEVAWQVNEESIGDGAQAWWVPIQGSHRIRLVSREGRVLDTAMITVKGVPTTRRPKRD